MRQEKAVISGSVALEFALAADWTSNTLKICVPRRKGDALIKFLVSREEYHTMEDVSCGADESPIINGYPDHASYKTLGVRSVTWLAKHGSSFRYIDVVESRDHHSTTPIFRFNATWAMNWITADSIRITYPLLTLNLTGVILRFSHKNSDFVRSWLNKYEARGFAGFKTGVWAREGQPCGATCRTIVRHTSDWAILSLPFGDPLHEDDSSTAYRWSINGADGRQICLNRACPQYGSSKPSNIPSRE